MRVLKIDAPVSRAITLGRLLKRAIFIRFAANINSPRTRCVRACFVLNTKHTTSICSVVGAAAAVVVVSDLGGSQNNVMQTNALSKNKRVCHTENNFLVSPLLKQAKLYLQRGD